MQQGLSGESVDTVGGGTNSTNLENSSVQKSPMDNVSELGAPSSAVPSRLQLHLHQRETSEEYLARSCEELEQKSKLEREEIETIKEEAIAELDLMRNQRKKMIDANVAKNESEQDSATKIATETGWETVATLHFEEKFLPRRGRSRAADGFRKNERVD